MTANELRINNFLTRVDVGVDRVGSLRHIGGRSKVNGLFIEQFNPIPLSEEWLIKLGAKKKYNGFYEFDRFYLKWLPSFKYWYVTEKGDIGYITKIEFVHEWQNVVLDLNGEELEVKP